MRCSILLKHVTGLEALHQILVSAKLDLHNQQDIKIHLLNHLFFSFFFFFCSNKQTFIDLSWKINPTFFNKQ